MRLATFLAPGEDDPRAGEVRGDEVVAFADGATVLDRLRLRRPQPGRRARRSRWPTLTLLAPVPRPRAIFGIGLNYAAHAAETGREPPEVPIVFMKLPSSVGGARTARSRCPAVVRAAGLRGRARRSSWAPAARWPGYAVADDVSARDLQGREPQWTRAKGFDNSCPFGPWVTTADEVPDPEDLGCARGSTASCARTPHVRPDLRVARARRVPVRDVHARARRPDPHRDAERRGHGPRPAACSWQSGDVVRIEIERLGGIEHRIA